MIPHRRPDYQDFMTKRSPTGAPAGYRAGSLEARAERLAAALKANLQRRKAQARQRAAAGGECGEGGDPAGAHDSARIADDKRSS